LGEAADFIIGSEVACSDGVCGELRRVVIDPVARAITHVVVVPKHRGTARLVPVHLVSSSSAKEIRLSCTKAQFHVLEDADEKQLLPGAPGEWGFEQDEMRSLPYFGLGMGAMGAVGGLGGVGMANLGKGMGMGRGTQRHVVTGDRVPVGEVEFRRGEPVHATDGPIGRVRGLVVDPKDRHVTHFLLDEGHLWGAKQVAIPIGVVTRVDDGVRISLTKDQVQDLPPVDLDRPV
jgi:sporulation protein YlmC with PRC-barrel domain